MSELQAQQVLPEPAYRYYAGGVGADSTRDANVAAWERLRLRPRVLRDVTRVDARTTVLGTPVRAPVLVAPTAYHRLANPDGEAATAAGAAAAGSLMIVSTRATVPFERIDATGVPWWFQVYLMQRPGLTMGLVDRAVAAGARALVLTGDTPYVSRAGAKLDPQLDAHHLLANMPEGTTEADTQQSPAATTALIGELHARTGLPVLVKGVLRADDAQECVAAGAAGIVVSNHGGRQLDGAVASADVLAEVVDAVGGASEVYVDGGVRTGVDVLRALGLGARAALVGRPVLWALATDGAAGVERELTGLATQTTLALALAGVNTPAEAGRDLISRAG